MVEDIMLYQINPLNTSKSGIKFSTPVLQVGSRWLLSNEQHI